MRFTIGNICVSVKMYPLVILLTILSSVLAAEDNESCANLRLESANGSTNPDDIIFFVTENETSANLWSKLVEANGTSKTVKRITVRENCILKLCYLNENTNNRTLKCKEYRNDSQTEGFHKPYWNDAAETIVGMDCSCKERNLQANECQDTCSHKNKWQISQYYSDSGNGQRVETPCAVLFRDSQCHNCIFDETKLLVNHPFEKTILDSLSIISSIVVRTHCQVTGFGYSQDESRLEKWFMFYENEHVASGMNVDINELTGMDNYYRFNCTCRNSDVVDVLSSAQTSTTTTTSANTFSIISPSRPESFNSNILIVVGSSTFGALVLIAVTIYGLQKFRKARKNTKGSASIVERFKPFNKEYNYMPGDIRINYQVVFGQGKFSIVYEAFLTSKSKISVRVAAKELKTSSLESDYLSVLNREIEILGSIGKHENIIGMIGVLYSYSGVNRLKTLILLDVCENKSLERFLRENKANFQLGQHPSFAYIKCSRIETMDARLLEKWAYQIANGMDHISSLNIIHNDLQARNILLDGKLNAKIGDFGLSKTLNRKDDCYFKPPLAHPLPLHSMPPEALEGFIFSLKSDVWAYGVCLWEIFTLGETPYKDLVFQDEMDLLRKIQGGYRLPPPEMCSSKNYEIMKSCWSEGPSERPSFSVLKKAFEL